jgi:hypothetical protein
VAGEGSEAEVYSPEPPPLSRERASRPRETVPDLSTRGKLSRGKVAKGPNIPPPSRTKRHGGLPRASSTRGFFGLGNGGEPPGKARNQTRP